VPDTGSVALDSIGAGFTTGAAAAALAVTTGAEAAGLGEAEPGGVTTLAAAASVSGAAGLPP